MDIILAAHRGGSIGGIVAIVGLLASIVTIIGFFNNRSKKK
jgi:hypothetical protein